MKASPFEFRIRFLTHTLIFALGFWAPWNYLLHADSVGANAHLWGYLSAVLSETGIVSITTAFNLLLFLGIAFAFAGAGLRIWGSAYLGAGIVQDGAMHAGVVAAGPYRHVRNPLYLGTFLHTLALALLMPRTGAIFAVILIAFVQIRLILGEEAFLTARTGPPYTAYEALVPRLWPSLKPRTVASGQISHLPQALLGEIYMIGVALSFAFAGWRYDAHLLIQCVIVSFGLSLVVRTLVPKPKPEGLKRLSRE